MMTEAISRKGSEVLSERRKLKRAISTGETRVGELLTEPTLPICVQRMRLVDLLDQVPYLRPTTVEEWLAEVPIKLTATVAEPTYRKRRILADRLTEWETKPAYGEHRRRPRRRIPAVSSGALHAEKVA